MAIRMKDKTRDKAQDKAKERPKQREAEGGARRFAGIQRFIRETRSELKKVVWPTRQAATNLTVIVASVAAAVGIFMGGVDFVFERIFEIILRAG